MPFHVDAQVAILEKATVSFVNSTLANIANSFLQMTAWLLSIVGVLLSFAIDRTLHIGDYMDNIPAIKEVWIVIRNLSSIFIIFLLIYTSISTIVGVGGKLGELVKNIVMAGLLINFSLFFVRLGIDASNLVSMQFYRAIVPNSSQGGSTVSKAFTGGGLSDVFMSSLRIPQIYQNTSTLKSTDAFLSIFIATTGGIIIMITAAFSFLAASIAFIARIGILLFIMALSPFYFAGWIFPQINKDVSSKLFEYFKSQLIFMPVYLFLMYIALRLISSPGFKAMFNASSTGIIPANEGPFGATSMGIVIQYIIAILFINAPLIAALQFGAKGAKWAPGLSLSKTIGGSMWRNTGSRVASRMAESKTLQKFAGKTVIGEQFLKGTKSVAGDYNKKLNERLSAREATYNSLKDGEAKTNYANRLAGSLASKTGRLSMGMTGRADRVGAARILTKREKEIKEEINKIQARRDELDRIKNGVIGRAGRPSRAARALNAVEQAEYDKIIDPTDPNKGSLFEENENLRAIQDQIAQFGTMSGGASAKDVGKREY